MKKIILSIAILSMSFAIAQDKEVKAAFAAIEANDTTTANAQISAADVKLNGNIALLEPEQQEQYYYTKGTLLLKSGRSMEGATFLAKITDLGKNKIYSGKNANKDKVYFVGKDAATASGIANLKETTYQTTTSGKMGEMIDPILQKASKEGIDAYNAKSYNVAGNKFKEVYFLLKAAGQEDQQYLYNAALSYGLAKDYANANELFTQLIDSGYTGVATTYSAKNKTTGQVSNFTKSLWDQSKKDPNFTDFKSETSKSIESDIYDAAAKLQIEDKKYDQALATIEKGLKKFPKNTFLAGEKSEVLNLTGKTEEYVADLKQKLANNPKDAISWYNLGVMQSKDPQSKDTARESFLRSVEIDPQLKNAYESLTYLEIGDESKTIEEFEKLKKAGNMDAANTVLKNRKARFANAIPYAEKWLQLDPTNKVVVTLLKNFYQSTGNDAKFKEFKAKEAGMK